MDINNNSKLNMKKLLFPLILLLFTFSSCGYSKAYNKALEIRGQMEIEKAKERTVIVINNNDTTLQYTTTSDTIVIKTK